MPPILNPINLTYVHAFYPSAQATYPEVEPMLPNYRIMFWTHTAYDGPTGPTLAWPKK